MTLRLKSLVLAILSPLLLWGCVVTPGKFAATLDIAADRSFAFSYVGEVYALDIGDEFAKGMAGGLGGDAKPAAGKIAWQAKDADDPVAKAADSDRKNRAIAETLRKEAGYRKVDYMGDGRFVIDYAASGRLTYPFVFPFNADAEIVIPFVLIELRGADRVRVKAPGFSANSAMKGMPDADSLTSKVDGTFTLTTDAEIVSQNNEAGATTAANGRKAIAWKVGPTTKDAPLAVLKVAGL